MLQIAKLLRTITLLFFLLINSACFHKTIVRTDPIPIRYQQSVKPGVNPPYDYDRYYAAPASYEPQPIEDYYRVYDTVEREVIPGIGLIIISGAIIGALFLL